MESNVNQLDLTVKLQALVYQDEDAWVARCPSLDIASQGLSQDEALNALREAVAGWIDSCFDRGVLREALEECGWHRLSHGSSAPAEADRVGMTPRGSLPMPQEKEISFQIPAYIASSYLMNAGHATN